MPERSSDWHPFAYWMSMCICLVTAAVCLSGAVMNARFSVDATDPSGHATAARYWICGCAGFLLLAIGAGLKASLLQRGRGGSSEKGGR